MSSPGQAPARRRSRRRWLRFSIRSLLVVVLLLSLPLAYLGMKIRGGQLQHSVAARITELGGTVVFDHHLDDAGTVDVARKPGAPKWMRDLFGESYGSYVVAVNLHSSEVSDDDLQQFGHLSKLSGLNLGCTDITDQGLSHLATLHNLESLDLHRTRVTDRGLAHLADMSQLVTLNLGGTKITDEGLKHLAPLESLSELHLTSTDVTDRGLERLTDLAGLEHLYLANTPITDGGLEQLSTLFNLRTVNLHQTQVTDAGTRHLSEKLPDLTIYGLLQAERVTRYETGVYETISVCRELNVYRTAENEVKSKWAGVMKKAAEQARSKARQIAKNAMKQTPLRVEPGEDGASPRFLRWEFQFDTSDVMTYARQLDGLDIAIGVIEPGDKDCGAYITRCAGPVPLLGFGDGVRDRLLINSHRAGYAELDKQLLAAADLDVDGLEDAHEVTLTIVHCLSPELESTLAEMELVAAQRSSPRLILKTVFGVRRLPDDSYKPYVLEQRFRDEFPLD